MDPIQFLDILDSSLSEAEMSALCRQFGVVFGAFPGSSKRDKIREFLGFVKRQGRMAGLAEATVALRPDLSVAVAQLFESAEQELSWLDQVAGGEGAAMDSGLTWRWSASSGTRSIQSGLKPSSDPAAGAKPDEPELARAEIPPNPYTPGVKVIDDTMFFGRANELDQIARLLTEEGHVAVIGGRAFGGSSLLRRVAGDMSGREGILVALVDMKNPAYYTSGELLNSIWTQWWERVKPGNQVQVRNLAEFVTAVRKLNAAGFHPLLLLDELEQLTWRPSSFDDGLFAAWHELGREGQLRFATSAHSSPADLLAQGGYQSRFFELFQQINLGLLDEQSARDLLIFPVQRAGLKLPDGAAEYLYLHAGPHPFFLQLAGYYLFDALAKSSYTRGEVIRRFEIAAEPYWHELWDSLSPLAQSHFPSSTIRVADGMGGRQLRILANRGVVIADEGGYRPFSDGFARWLTRMQAAMQSAAAVPAPTPV